MSDVGKPGEPEAPAKEPGRSDATAKKKLSQRLGRRGLVGVCASVAVVLVAALAGYLLVAGDDSGQGDGSSKTSVADGGDDSNPSGTDAAVGVNGRPDSQDPRNMGQTFGLKPVMGKWRHTEKGFGSWILTVDKSGALHSKESKVPEQLGQIEPASGRTYELMIQDPRAGGTASYTARLSSDGGTLELGIGTTKIRKFTKMG